MKKIITTLLFMLCFGLTVSAGNTPKLVSGKISDKQTGETLTGVKVQVKGTDTYCYSDMEGNFVLSVNVTGNTEVLIDMVGYQPAVLKAQELSVRSTIVLNPR